jgi:hypothetical protein
LSPTGSTSPRDVKEKAKKKKRKRKETNKVCHVWGLDRCPASCCHAFHINDDQEDRLFLFSLFSFNGEYSNLPPPQLPNGMVETESETKSGHNLLLARASGIGKVQSAMKRNHGGALTFHATYLAETMAKSHPWNCICMNRPSQPRSMRYDLRTDHFGAIIFRT